MATPQSTTSQDEGSKPGLEQPTFRFCSECSNMLYPKEDEDSHRLQYTCRTCQYSEEATSTCVYRHELNTQAGETAGVTQDVGSDPTVGDLLHAAQGPVTCTGCGSVILCARCSLPASSLTLVPVPVDASDRDSNSSRAGSIFSFFDNDPSAEYDEEPESEHEHEPEMMGCDDATSTQPVHNERVVPVPVSGW